MACLNVREQLQDVPRVLRDLRLQLQRLLAEAEGRASEHRHELGVAVGRQLGQISGIER